MSYIFLAISILAETVATLSLKSADGFKNLKPSLIVAAGYGIAFYFLSLTLKEIPVGIVYATWSGAGIILISIGSYFLFKQVLDLYALLGIFLIIAGVVLVNFFSKSSIH